MIRFHCLQCGSKLKAPSHYAGKIGRCHKCKTRVEIPHESELNGGRVADEANTNLETKLEDITAIEQRSRVKAVTVSGSSAVARLYKYVKPRAITAALGTWRILKDAFNILQGNRLESQQREYRRAKGSTAVKAKPQKPARLRQTQKHNQDPLTAAATGCFGCLFLIVMLAFVQSCACNAILNNTGPRKSNSEILRENNKKALDRWIQEENRQLNELRRRGYDVKHMPR